MRNNEQVKIDIYLDQPEVKMVLDMLSLKYDFVINELANVILNGELANNEAVDFLVEEFNFEPASASELLDVLSENVIEPYYVYQADDLEDIGEENSDESVIVNNDNKIKWKDFIKPKIIMKAMEELDRVSSGDVSRIRNYLWKSLGLNKPDEVVVILSWLARTGELVKTWQEDSRFKGILKKYIVNKYSEEIAENIIEQRPTAALLSLALEMVLVDKLGLSKGDSAMVLMSIIDNMPDDDKPKYILLAYVDAKDSSFNWNKLQATGNSLQLAM